MTQADLANLPLGHSAHIQISVGGVSSPPTHWDGLLHLVLGRMGYAARCGEHVYDYPVKFDWEIMAHRPAQCDRCWQVVAPALTINVPRY